MKWLVCFLLVMLSACTTTVPVTNLKLSENQTFSEREGTSTVQVRWVRVSNERLQSICSLATNMADASGRFLGCAGREPTGTCVIYTNTETTHQVFGHELRHCFQGNFHK